MKNTQEIWKSRIAAALNDMASQSGVALDDVEGRLKSAGRPPKDVEGDIAFPLFAFAKDFSLPPVELAARIAEILGGQDIGVTTAGPYVNIFMDRAATTSSVLEEVAAAGDRWGWNDSLAARRIVIEFSSPNTNKPLHLGHLRNDILGESCSRLLQSQGAQVRKINLVNDRGVHICKSMLAYRKFADGQTPEDLGIKSDRFVGDLYVKYAQWAAGDPDAETQVQALLREWEAGDPETRKLWETLNGWALSGIEATYQRTGIQFDCVYRESETYLLGRDVVLEGLESGVFYKADDGSIRLDLSDVGLDTKVLLRSDGTSVYMTQDLGNAIGRYREWPFDEHIYVVGNEQEYHFRVLFHALSRLGHSWASRLRHLSYGMVNLPHGKMKSREGTIVDADDLIDTLSALARQEIANKSREDKLEDAGTTAESIALAALHYYLLHVSPTREVIFDPEKSLSFNGNTGPYLQYMVARIGGLGAKASKEVLNAHVDTRLLDRGDEWQIVRHIVDFPERVAQAAEKLDPSILAGTLYELAKDFSRYYHETPIARADDPALGAARLALARAVLTTLRNGFYLLNIPYIESM